MQIALAYYHAWTNKDLERAMSYIDDEIVCDAPAGRIEGAAAYRDFIGPFVGILKRAGLWAAFGDDETAVVMYAHRIPSPSAPPQAPNASPCTTARSPAAASSSTASHSRTHGEKRANATLTAGRRQLAAARLVRFSLAAHDASSHEPSVTLSSRVATSHLVPPTRHHEHHPLRVAIAVHRSLTAV